MNRIKLATWMAAAVVAAFAGTDAAGAAPGIEAVKQAVRGHESASAAPMDIQRHFVSGRKYYRGHRGSFRHRHSHGFRGPYFSFVFPFFGLFPYYGYRYYDPYPYPYRYTYVPPPRAYPRPVEPAPYPPAARPSNCREIVMDVIIGGVPQEAVGTACRQADGSWKIVN